MTRLRRFAASTRQACVPLVLAISIMGLILPAAAQRAGDIGAGPIEGTWTVTGSEKEGTPWREIAGATMTIGGGQFTLQFAGSGAVYKGDVKQVGGAQVFDFVQKEGPDAGKTWLALVSSNGQLLKICFTYSGENPRPTTLTTSPGEGTTLIGLRHK